jgi:predicted HD phosphohydrolase
VTAFETEPYSRDGIQLRRWDDEGKIAGWEVPDLSHFEQYIDSCRNP